MGIKLKKNLIFVIVIAAAATIVYANSFGGKFLWDNRFEIVDNTYIKSFDLGSIFTHSTTSGAGRESGFYRPLVSLSFAIDYKIWGVKPGGFHFTNFLLHILSAVLVYFIFNLLYGRRAISFFTGLLFAIHPIQVETVSYISGRSDLLSVFFSLLSIYFFIKQDKNVNKLRRNLFYISSLVSLLLAMLSKEIAVIVPLLLLLICYFFLKNDNRKSFYNLGLRIGLPFVLSVSYSFLRLGVLNFSDGFSTFSNTNFFARIVIFLKALPVYWQMLLAPSNLRFRLDNVDSFANQWYLLVISPVILAIIVYFSYLSIKKNRFLVFGFGWFFISLAPVSSIILPINYVLGERWLRLPAIGLFFLAAIGIQELLKRISPHKLARSILYVIIIAYFVLLSFITIKTNRIWSNSISFYSHLTKYYTYDIDNRLNLAISYKEAGQKENALKEYKTIIEHTEFYIKNEGIVKNSQQLARSYKLLGSLYIEFGQYDKSIFYLEKLRELAPEDWKPYSLLAQVYILKGDYKEAAKLLEKVLSIDPGNARAKKYLEMLNAGTIPSI